jgi:hypothetical protein
VFGVHITAVKLAVRDEFPRWQDCARAHGIGEAAFNVGEVGAHDCLAILARLATVAGSAGRKDEASIKIRRPARRWTTSPRATIRRIVSGTTSSRVAASSTEMN